MEERTEYKKPNIHKVPEEVGTYLVKMRDKNGQDLNDGKFYWNGLATIYGRAPFLKIKVWDFVRHTTDFINFPHYVEWGDKVFTTEDFMQAASSYDDYGKFNSDGYNHDKLLNRYE